MTPSVYTVIGSQLRTSSLEATGVDLTTDRLGRVPALGHLVLLRDPREDGWSYLCTFEKHMSPDCNDILTVIYQDTSIWRREQMESVLKPLSLWNPSQFGVWVIPVWEQYECYKH